MNQLTAEVVSNEKVLTGLERERGRGVGGAYLLQIRAPEIARESKPGQFVMLRCPDSTLPRPFSVHKVDGENIGILYTVWEEGTGTNWMSHRQTGDTIDLFGPMGNGFGLDQSTGKLLLIAGGIGVAPLCFLAGEALKQGKYVRLLAGAASASQLCSNEIIPAGVEYFASTEDGKRGQPGFVTGLIPGHASWADQVFICGPMPMYRALIDQLSKLGLKDKPVQVSLEMRMGCGVGVCYSCTINTKQGLKQVCKDGPVFDLQDIVWDELVKG